MEPKYNLTANELVLFSRIREGNIDEIKLLLNEGDVRIDCLDEHGMTPLQHASYKGNYNLCKLFMDCGADINIDHHDHHYSSLMFAGLSGNLDVVNLLLENGASTTAVNSINRTASQLAAFVGNHDVVSLITNFIPKEDIEWYTVPHDTEKEPKLLLPLAKPLHQLIIKRNMNPVYLAMFIQKNIPLLEGSRKVTNVLDHLCGKLLNDGSNEMLSMKMHHISFIVRACSKFFNEQKTSKNEGNALEPLIKHWIKEEGENRVPLALEKMVRQSIREYPFCECALFQQLVRTIAPVSLGDEPTAIVLFNQSINGQRDVQEIVSCQTCGENRAEKKCSVCKSVVYCDKYCQKLHWFTHKKSCPQLANAYHESISKSKCEEGNMLQSLEQVEIKE